MKKLLAGCALALAMFSIAPGLSALEPMPLTNGAAAVVVTYVAQPSAALATVVTSDVTAVSLTLREMQQVHGSGWFSKLVNVVKKVIKWVLSPTGQKILQAILDLLNQWFTQTQQTSNSYNQTDTYSNTTESNEYYDAAGNFVGSDESSTGDVLMSSDISHDDVLIMQ
jgi:ABC-type thiamine transport system substrate-binding protein